MRNLRFNKLCFSIELFTVLILLILFGCNSGKKKENLENTQNTYQNFKHLGPIGGIYSGKWIYGDNAKIEIDEYGAVRLNINNEIRKGVWDLSEKYPVEEFQLFLFKKSDYVRIDELVGNAKTNKSQLIIDFGDSVKTFKRIKTISVLEGRLGPGAN